MSSIVSGLIRRVLTKALDDFFTYGELDVEGIGSFRIRDLELRPEVVPTNLPVKVRECSVENLDINVSPLKMFSLNTSYSISVRVKGVKLLLEDRPETEWNEKTEFEALKAAKLATIQALRDAALQSVEAKLSSLDGELSSEAVSDSSVVSLAKKMAVRVIGNLEVVVERIELSYFFEGENQTGDFGMTLESFGLINTSQSPSMDLPSATTVDDHDFTIAGVRVEPVQGNTEKIMTKALSISGIEIFMQKNRASESSQRCNLIDEFSVESIIAVNLDGDPRPTLGIVELRVSEVVVDIDSNEVAMLTFASARLARQVEWKMWCQQRFDEMIQTGISTEDQIKCFRAYELMFMKGKQDVNELTKKPKKPQPESSGVDVLLADLSWLERREMMAHPQTIENILTSVAEVMAKREKEKIEKQLAQGGKGIVSSIKSSATSWVSWALGGLSTSDSGEIEADIEKTAASARELSTALGLINEADVDEAKLRKQRRNIFDAIDKDKSGDIDVAELQIGLAMAGTTLSSKKVADLIETFDQDKDGTIDFEEFNRMCSLAPLRLQAVALNDGEDGNEFPVLPSEFAVFSFALFVEGFQFKLSSGSAAMFHTSMEKIRIGAAIENPLKPAVGRKVLTANIYKIGAGLRSSTNSVELLKPIGELHDALVHYPPETQESEQAATSFSAIRVRVASLSLVESDTSPSLLPYCVLQHMAGDIANEEQETALGRLESEKSMTEGFAYFNFRSQRQTVPPLAFEAGHGSQRKSETVHVQVRLKRVESGWLRRMVKQRDHVVSTDEDDLILCSVDVEIPIEADRGVGFSKLRLMQMDEYTETFQLLGGFGKVTLSIEKQFLRKVVPSENLQDHKTHLEVEVVANTSLNYADVALGIELPRYAIDVDPSIPDMVSELSETLFKDLETLAWSELASVEEHVSWRCEKTILEIRIPETSGIAKEEIAGFQVACGSESVRVASFSPDAPAILGEMQNLHQLLESSDPQQLPILTMSLSPVLKKREPIEVQSIDLQEILTDALAGKTSLLFWKNTDAESARVRIAIDISRRVGPKSSRGQKHETFTSEELDGEEEDDVEVPHRSNKEEEEGQDAWISAKPADVFGLAHFVPLNKEDVARLHIQVVEGKGLRAADLGGTSDPYCVLNCHREEVRTHVISKTLNPDWSDKMESSHFVFGPLPGVAVAPASPETLDLRVMDHDFGGDWTDDLLGVAHIPLADLYEKIVGPQDQFSFNHDSVRNKSSKRYSRQPSSSALIDKNKVLDVWVPLFMQDDPSKTRLDLDAKPGMTREGAEGEVHLRCWLERSEKPRKIESIIPLALDFTMLVKLSLPDLKIPAEHELNGSNKPIVVHFGEAPFMTFNTNASASDGLVGSLQLHKQLMDRMVHTIQKPGLKIRSMRSASEGNDSGYFSASEGNFTKGQFGARKSDEWTGKKEVDDEEDFKSVPSAPPARDDSNDEESSGTLATGPVINAPLAFGFHLDHFEMEVAFVSTTSRRRKAFLRFSVEDVKSDVKYAVHRSGLPILQVQVQVFELRLHDCWQKHDIIGRRLVERYDEEPESGIRNKMDGLYRPQFRVSLIYHRTEKQTRDISLEQRVPELLIGFQVREMFILATALLDFGVKVGLAFGFFSPSTTKGAGEGGLSQKEKQGEPRLGMEMDAKPALLLPISALRVNFRFDKIEIHVMNRRTLCLETPRKVHRFPPKSTIFKTDVRLKMEVESDNAAARISPGVPSCESFALAATCEVVLARTRVDRSRFKEIPLDFISGENVVVEPFNFRAKMKTRPIQMARNLELNQRLASFRSSNSGGSRMSLFFKQYDFDLEDYQDSLSFSKDSEEPKSSGPSVSNRDLKAEDIWGVNQYTFEAKRLLAKELEKARDEDFKVSRTFEIKLDGLEARLDTGDQVFLMQTAQNQIDMLTELAEMQQTGQQSPTSGYDEPRTSTFSLPSDNQSISSRPETSFSVVAENLIPVFGDELGGSDHSVVRAVPENVKKGSSSSPEIDVKCLESADAVMRTHSFKKKFDRRKADESCKEPLHEELSQQEPFESPLPSWFLAYFVPMLVVCPEIPYFRPSLPGDLPGSWDVERDKFALGKISERASRVAHEHKAFDQVNVYVNQLMIGLGNNLNGYPAPFLRMTLAQFNVNVCSRTLFSKDLLLRGYMSMTSNSYNEISKVWEPFLEPWSLFLNAEQNPAAVHGLLLQAVATRRLNINVTDAFLKSAVNFLAGLRPNFQPLDDERLHGSYTPNYVVNETGHGIEIWPVHDPSKQKREVEPQTLTYRGEKQIFRVEKGEAIRLHLHDTTRIRRKMLSLLQQMRQNKRRILVRTIKVLRNALHRSVGSGSFLESGSAEDIQRKEALESLVKEQIMEDDEHEIRERAINDLKELFHFMDEDDSGEISCIELQNALSRNGEPISIEEVLYAIGEMDEEGVENVDAKETGIDLQEFLDFFLPSIIQEETQQANQYAGLDVQALACRLHEFEKTNSGPRREFDLTGVSQVPLEKQILIAPSNTTGDFMLNASAVVPSRANDEEDSLQHTTPVEMHENEDEDDRGRIESEDEDDDVSFEPASSPEEDAEQKEEDRKSLHIAASTLLMNKSRSYHFQSADVQSLWVVANIKKMGRSSAGDVLFLETPLRLENRTVVPLAFTFTCQDAEDGSLVFREEMFTLAPGDEQSVPVKYLYGSQLYGQGRVYGVTVKPLLDRSAKQRLVRNMRGIDDKDASMRMQRKLSTASSASNRSEASATDIWSESGSIVQLDGGESITVLQPFRVQDDLLDEDGELMSDALLRPQQSPFTNALIGCSRVEFDPPESDRRNDGEEEDVEAVDLEDPNLILGVSDPPGDLNEEMDDDEDYFDDEGNPVGPRRFECVALTQRNALRKFEMKEILTVQVISASGLKAADSNGKSDPFVVLMSFDGKVKVESFKTPVVKEDLNPVWPNKATFRFGEHKEPLSRQKVLRFAVIDYDVLTSNDPLGYVHVDFGEIKSWFKSASLQGSVHSEGGDARVVKRTFSLKPGKGVKEPPGQGQHKLGTLSVEFSYQRFAAATGLPLLHAQHVVSFYPPVMLENLLPHPIYLRIKELDRRSVEVVHVHKFKLRRGAKVPFHGLDGALLDYLNPTWLKHRRKLDKKATEKKIQRSVSKQDAGRMREMDNPQWKAPRMVRVGNTIAIVEVCIPFGSFESAWSEPIIQADSPVFLQSNSSSSPRPVSSVALEVSRNPYSNGGARTLSIYSQIWVCNKSDLKLDFYAFERRARDNRNPDEMRWVCGQTPGHAVEDLLCLHVNGLEGRLHLRGHMLEHQPALAFQSDLSKPLFNEDDDDIKAGLPSRVTLRGLATVGSGEDGHSSFAKLLCMVRSIDGVPVEKSETALCVGISASWAGPTQQTPQRGFTWAVAPGTRQTGGGLLVFPNSTGLVALDIPVAMLFNAETSSSTLIVSVFEVPTSQSMKAQFRESELHQIGVGEVIEWNKDLSVSLRRGTRPEIECRLNAGGMGCDLLLALAEVPLTEDIVESASLRPTTSAVRRSMFQREVSVTIVPLYGMYQRTTIMTVGPRFIFANLTNEAVLVKQAGSPDECAIYLPAAHHDTDELKDVRKVCFHLQIAPGSRIQRKGESLSAMMSLYFDLGACIQMRLAEPGSQWTAPFPLGDADDFGVQLRGPDRERAARLWFDANASGPSEFFVLRPLSNSQTTFAIQNLTTNRTFAVLQVPAKSHGLIADVKSVFKQRRPARSILSKLSYAADHLEPGMELPLPLDMQPKKGLRVHVMVIPIRENGEHDMSSAKTIRFKDGLDENFGDELKLSVRSEGTRLAVRIIEFESSQQQGDVAKKSKRVRRRDAKNNEALAILFATLQPKKPNFEFVFNLSSVCFSFFSSARRLEIAYVAMQRIHLELSLETVSQAGTPVSRASVDLCVENFQIDSSQVDARYDVMLYVRRKLRKKSLTSSSAEPILSSVSERAKSKTKLLWDSFRQERAENGFFRLQLVYDSDPEDKFSFDVFKYFQVKMRKIEVQIDGAMLGGLLLVIDPILRNGQESGSIEGEGEVQGMRSKTSFDEISWVVATLLAPIPVPEQDTIFFDIVRIEPTAFIITVNIGSDDELRDTLKKYGISPIYLSLAKRFTRLEDFSLDLSKGYYEALTSHKFQTRYTSAIIRSVIRQIHEVVFNFTKRAYNTIPLLRRRGDVPEKIREPLVPVGGQLVPYGPGAKPAIVESQKEQAAALVLERAFLQALQRKREGENGEMELDATTPSSKSMSGRMLERIGSLRSAGGSSSREKGGGCGGCFL